MNDVTIEAPTIDLPYILRRPNQIGALAKLTLVDHKDDGDALKRWRLTGSPMIIELGRKLFPAARANQVKSITWPAIQPLFGDLLMLLHRHPVEVGPSARNLWEEQYAEELRQWELRNLPKVAARSLGDLFIGTLKPFQEEDVDAMVTARRMLNGDDLGLGKTPQGLAAIDRVNEYPAVVVCQSHVLRHWQRKIPEFMRTTGDGKKLAWATLSGFRPKETPKADLYLLHYLTLWAWEGFLRARNIKTVIFDEVQELRHPGTRKHDAASALSRNARNCWGLSGTPFYNRGPEIYDVINSISRGALGTRDNFLSTWCVIDDSGHYLVEDPQALGQYLRDRNLLIRRLKDDPELKLQIPEVPIIAEPIDADNGIFAELIKRAARLAKQAYATNDPFDRGRMEAEAIAQTRLATGIAKSPAAIAFIRALQEAGEPTMVFSHHHAVHDAIADALAGFKPVRITGKETIAQKDKSQEAFCKGETNLVLIALRAATGLDGFQERATVIVIPELDWSPQVIKQARDRVRRMGLKHRAMLYLLYCDLGTDPYMLLTNAIKEKQFSGMMHDPEITDEDIAAAKGEADKHMRSILNMLRSQ